MLTRKVLDFSIGELFLPNLAKLKYVAFKCIFYVSTKPFFSNFDILNRLKCPKTPFLRSSERCFKNQNLKRKLSRHTEGTLL